MPINLDVHTGVVTAMVLAALFGVISLINGIKAIRKGRKSPYFRIRRDQMVQGWKLLFLFVSLGVLTYVLNSYAEPAIYGFFPPSITPTLSPTISPTATISLTPSITSTPTITDTPAITNTPTITSTPHVPMAIEAQFEGNLTPPADAVISKLQFTNQGVDSLYRPIQPAETFTNPVGEMYAYFTYDGMSDNVQWTALWYRDGELVNFETSPWEGGTGGAGFSEWAPDAEAWKPGEYEVQIFLGLDWIRVGSFTVEGDPPTSTPTASRTPSPTPTGTKTFTPSPWPTVTPSATPTETTTSTLISTSTPTLRPSPTETASSTPQPTSTPSSTPSRTPAPTLTASATSTPKPTYPPPPSKTPTITRRPLATPITPTATITRWPTPTKKTSQYGEIP